MKASVVLVVEEMGLSKNCSFWTVSLVHYSIRAFALTHFLSTDILIHAIEVILGSDLNI